MSTMTPTQTLAEQEIVLTRLFDAPRDLVFRAWTDPKHLRLWWGPQNFTNPVCELDLRVGGSLRIVMRAPDGNEYPMKGIFQEVIAPERIVFTNIAVDTSGNTLLEGLTIVTFAEKAGKTELRVQTRAAALVPEAVQMLAGMETGWSMSLDRLTESVSRTERIEAAEPFRVITRTFDAPRDLVFQAWAEREHMLRWWGRKGFEMLELNFDFLPGGALHCGMRMPDGTEIWSKWDYREIAAPEKIVFVNYFSDADGNIVRHPFRENWPLEMLSIFTFAERDGKTILSMDAAALSSVEAERAVFADGREMMFEGWNETWDRLAEAVEEH